MELASPTERAELVCRALAAFATDPSYAVAMAEAAATVEHNRAVWAVRRQLRAAERTARAECARSAPFLCHNTSPCGVGACKFAAGELTMIETPNCSGRRQRPQASSAGDYSIEPAIRPLMALQDSQG